MNFQLKKIYFVLFYSIILGFTSLAQERKDLKLNLDSSGSKFVQVTLLNQTWVRLNQSNPGTLVEGEAKANTLDIGLRRTRFQIIGQLSDRAFFYAQMGMNNFNSQFNSNLANRKQAFFIHDALCEYKLSTQNQLKIGGGLTIANGLSRFSNPSITSIMTTDVPVFAQATVDQTDEFSRKLSIYARGQIGRLDYRVIFSDPFPITSSGTAVAPISTNANFSPITHRKQVQAYFIWQFFEHEAHTTPYMSGTQLGGKKILNIAIGGIHQANAMYKLGANKDTIYQPMTLLAIESYVDLPINKSRGSAISAYTGLFNMNYGTNYLRYNGIMNPANALASSYTSAIKNQGATFGNALPMFGTGTTWYTQVGYLLPTKNKAKPRLLPYVATTISKYDRLQGKYTAVTNVGTSILMNGHKTKVSLDWQTRPTYTDVNNVIVSGARKNTLTMQYQLFF